MPDFLHIVSALREQMLATLSRSDVLRPLSWLVLILTASFLGSAYLAQPPLIVAGAFALLLTAICVYFYSYLFCLHRDRDALRSEKFSLEKFAIEHGMYGDSQIGLIEPDKTSKIAATPAPAITQQGTDPEVDR